VTADSSPGETPKRFAVFRAKDARADVETTILQFAPFSAIAAEGAKRAMQSGIDKGSELKLLFEMPGFSLVYAWFKSDYPLPLHTHNCDCLYYIIAGSLRMGQDELGAGDGFFVGRDVPYRYRPGSAGVEVLEFRATNLFDIKVLANNPLFWEQAVTTTREHQASWANEKPPSHPDST
jgi:mannose-6-phosphate isomerase-like protein (cupin superfamily)